jgi:hypothetical protein
MIGSGQESWWKPKKDQHNPLLNLQQHPELIYEAENGRDSNDNLSSHSKTINS